MGFASLDADCLSNRVGIEAVEAAIEFKTMDAAGSRVDLEGED